MADINNNDIWIDVETLAKLKNITRRAVRLALNQNKYEYKVENIRGGKTYKIKLSTLEEELQLKYFQEYYDDYKTCDNEVIELSNLNIKQEKLISENQRKIALAKYDLIYAWLDFRKEYKRDKLKTGGNIPDKEFLQLYNTGMFQEEIFKILGKARRLGETQQKQSLSSFFTITIIKVSVLSSQIMCYFTSGNVKSYVGRIY